jgi:hypothetical protein
MPDPNLKCEKDSLLGDIAYKHTPDSVRKEAYRELQEKFGVSHREAQILADEKFGDFWG